MTAMVNGASTSLGASRAGLDARFAAIGVLDAVLERGLALDEVLAADRKLGALEPRDRAFARLLIATVLRRLGQIDDALACVLRQGIAATPAPALRLLRLAAAQLLFLETPAHAAVATTLDLAQGRVAALRKLLNGVLRALASRGPAILAGQDAARLNTPDWLWRSWTQAHGEANTRAIASAHLAEPPLDLTVKADAESWARALGARLLPTGSLRLAEAGNVAELAGFAEGAWWVQNAAAAIPARLLGDIAGKRVIDLCCAPGGKTAQLAAAGALVSAVDRAPKRLARVRENLERLGLSATLIEADAATWRPSDRAQFVLLDAPCSATGTIRRHPDIARRKGEAEIAKLVAVQDRLLRAAATMLAPGGVLVYATCSLEPEEGERRIASFLAEHRDFARAPIAPHEVGGAAELLTAAGELRTLPCHWADRGGLDGFFAARLARE
jgi:16S rRNA (cytosine967-C5)-methyltransferase